jgi:hypothetical protein
VYIVPLDASAGRLVDAVFDLCSVHRPSDAGLLPSPTALGAAQTGLCAVEEGWLAGESLLVSITCCWTGCCIDRPLRVVRVVAVGAVTADAPEEAVRGVGILEFLFVAVIYSNRMNASSTMGILFAVAEKALKSRYSYPCTLAPRVSEVKDSLRYK